MTSSEEMLRLAAELQLADTRAVLDATLDALADGVLVVDHETRGVRMYNRRFAEMWQIPADALASKDDQRLLGCVVSMLADPDEFFARVGYLYEHALESSQEEIKLVDGRLFERHSAPVRALDGKVLGRVWFFHDVTRQRRAADELREARVAAVDAERRTALVRFERELAIAQQIQTSILPRAPGLAGYELAADMKTATEVGGDYYDVITTPDGSGWIGIGDVSGHGLNAGLVMLMLQSGIAALVRQEPSADPGRLLALINEVLYHNIRTRLGLDDFATMTLFHASPDGRLRFAGAHEELIVWRASPGCIDRIPTPGTWLGASPDISAAIPTSSLRLEPGDLLILYTDGITESRNASRQQFDIDRLANIVAANHDAPCAQVCAAILAAAAAWSATRADDQTVVVLRYRGA